MKLIKFNPKKSKAQAMVEFAIALPILLMLIYGLLETGRLLFTYSSVTNATRQAVRYGSTTGAGSNGVTKRYLDCTGIKAAAQASDFLNVFNDSDIEIWYDSGPNTGTKPGVGLCGAVASLSGNNNRVVVRITSHFVALVPKLVPFVTRDITGSSARTIIIAISIPATDTPGAGPGKENTTTTITADTPDPSQVGQTVTVTVTVTGTTTTPTGIVNITGADTLCSITLSGGTGSCSVTFTSAGAKTITATYIGDATHNGSSDTETHTVNAAPTVTTITADTPDPSNLNESVKVTVTVTSTWGGIPTGTVNITAPNTNCSITLSNGTGNCSVTFTSSGAKTITATYVANSNYTGSTDTEPHNVTALTSTPTRTPTITKTPTRTSTPTAASCDVTYFANSTASSFDASITIKNNGGTDINGYDFSWVFTAGQQVNGTPSNVTTFSQNGSIVSISNPAGSPWGTIPANGAGFVLITFQGTYTGSNPPPTNFTLNGLPCTGGGPPLTATPTPSQTPSPIPTAINCSQLTHERLTYAGSTMNMVIHNFTGIVLNIRDITVTWNHDTGRSGNLPLTLTDGLLGSSFWSGSAPTSPYTITPASLTIPTGDSTITFIFNSTYTNKDATEQIFINISTPGCNFINSSN